MKFIEWDKGLNTNIEQIDRDHKTLLDLINRFYEALESNASHDVLKEAIEQLETFTIRHFSLEESIAKEHDCFNLEAHSKEHRSFMDEVTRLKQVVFKVDSKALAEEIVRFLSNWVVNHIISFDIPLANKVQQSEERHLPVNSWQSLLTWLASRLSLRKRIILTGLIPILCIMLVCGYSIWGDVAKLRKAEKLKYINQLNNSTSDLIHHLQAERGMSVGVINSNYQKFTSDVLQLRSATDKSIERLQRITATDLENTFDIVGNYFNLTSFDAQLLLVLKQRKLLMRKTASSPKLRETYTNLINLLLSNYDRMLHLYSDNGTGNILFSNISMLYVKEKLGLQRALGLKAIELEATGFEQLTLYSTINGEQKGYLSAFERTALKAQLNLWQRLTASETFSTAEALSEQLLQHWQQGSLTQLDGEKWWSVQTARMNALYQLQEQLNRLLSNNIDSQLTVLKHNIYRAIFIAVTVLFLSILACTLFIKSVTGQIKKITAALKQLSQGNSSQHLSLPLATDELSEITWAYELCRMRQLQGKYRHCAQTLSESQAERYKELSSSDYLTGAFNRRKYIELFQLELQRVRRHQRPFSLIMLDIDHFKHINDSYGHSAGDLVLQRLAACVVDKLRETDSFCRLGGEEFAILLPETTEVQSQVLAERLRLAIAQLEIEYEEHKIQITSSFGIASIDVDTPKLSLEKLTEKCDQALYRAKEQGRNQVCLAP